MFKPIIDVSTNKLLANLGEPDVKIIDIRPVDSYNGWQMQSEPRGGHIPKAKSLPAKWLKYLEWIEMILHRTRP